MYYKNTRKKKKRNDIDLIGVEETPLYCIITSQVSFISFIVLRIK